MKIEKKLASRTQRLVPTLLVAVAITLFACKGDDPLATKHNVEFILELPTGIDASALEAVEVSVTGTSLAKEEKGKCNAEGKISFSLEAGVYNVSASKITEEFSLNGSMQVTVSGNASFKVKLHAASLAGGLIFKEIYYSGSETPEGKTYFSDQFVEIYNNSDEVLYLDGLGICCISPEASGKEPLKWVDASGNLLPRLPASGYVCYFPGSGKDYPIQPRTSVVVAQDAIDHQSDPLGNPKSPVNLGQGKANWELYVGHINDGKDADVAEVPNLEVLYATQTTRYDALYSVFGPAMILFRLPQGVDPKEFANNPENIATEPGDTKGKTKYLMIPKEYVVDAVEGVRPEKEKRNKRLHTELDAGYVFCQKAYNSKSVRRKVKQIIDGKVIYQDSNNSSKDFLSDQTPTPGVHPTKID